MGSYANLKRDIVFALSAIGAVAVTSFVGQIATYPNLVPWYAGLFQFAKLDFCSGVDDALRADGVCALAHLACAETT